MTLYIIEPLHRILVALGKLDVTADLTPLRLPYHFIFTSLDAHRFGRGRKDFRVQTHVFTKLHFTPFTTAGFLHPVADLVEIVISNRPLLYLQRART